MEGINPIITTIVTIMAITMVIMVIMVVITPNRLLIKARAMAKVLSNRPNKGDLIEMSIEMQYWDRISVLVVLVEAIPIPIQIS